MKSKPLFFLLSGILFQAKMDIYAMEQAMKHQVALKGIAQMRLHSVFIFPNIFWRSS